MSAPRSDCFVCSIYALVLVCAWTVLGAYLRLYALVLVCAWTVLGALRG